MHKIIIVISFLLCIALVPASFALDEQGRNAGQSAGNFGLSIIGNSSGLDARSKMPLTDQNTQLRTFDGTQQRTAAVLCGQGTVQEQNKAISVNVMSYSIYVSSDSNNDGYLDASGSFYVSKVCHSGYQYGGGYYVWVVDANGIVSSASSASPLDGCLDPSAAPPSYTGGKIAELYSRMTGRQITKSETVDTTVNYYAGSVKDCNNSPKDISQTKYYSNPYSMEGDGVAQLTTGCPAGDTYCQAYKSAPAGVSNAQSNVSGPGQGTTTCSITRTIIDAKGPRNGVICEAGKLYYGVGYDETAKYCMSTKSKWDYNSMFRIRCNQYGTEMKLEGWAFWEGAPCGNGIQANYPPDNQVSYQLTYGGNITDLIIGQLSVNRRSGGDNISPNDLQADMY